MGLVKPFRVSLCSAVHAFSGFRLTKLVHSPSCSFSKTRHADSGAKLLILEHP